MVITDQTPLWAIIVLVVWGSNGQVAPRVVPEGAQGLPKVYVFYFLQTNTFSDDVFPPEGGHLSRL